GQGAATAGARAAWAQGPLRGAAFGRGRFEGRRQPQEPRALAERLGLATDLVAAWARMLHAQGWLAKRGDAYRIGPPVAWLLDAPEAGAPSSLLEHPVEAIAPPPRPPPQLVKGGRPPPFGRPQESLAMVAATTPIRPR